ncbi:MAG: sugar ABC transporter ATP-binding protein, partial [Chitinophagaceae bacterium]|nr:sugar ABC transporter ATP-binding protein [Anaerolineae bacterium]
MTEFALQMLNISKAYPGVQALDNVSLAVLPGEVHALVGENGAGKSTLMKILFGAVNKDAGDIVVNGQSINIHSPSDSQKHGISMVHQELNLIPQMNTAQNIFLGKEITYALGITNPKTMREAARDLIRQLSADFDVTVPVRRLSIAQRQLVEIAKALSTNADILVMDEPTSSLTDREIDDLFNTLRDLTQRGVSIIFVSHRMEEIFEICNRVTVLRDGKNMGTRNLSEINTDDIIQMMVGRDISAMYPKVVVPQGREILRVENITLKGALENVSFSAHAGEVIGIAGLVGAGRTELSEVLFGARKADSGTLFLNDAPVHFATPRDAIQKGIGLLTADRKEQGLVLNLPMTVNISLSRVDKVSKANIINRAAQTKIAQKYIDELSIRPGNTKRRAKFFSGGNQQKVVLAKWLFSDAQILIFNEPTRGIDVGAKVEIYQLMNALAAAGGCIIMISSELPEVIGMSDRIFVMREGRFVQEFKRSDDHQWPETIKSDILRVAMGEVA